MRILHTADWHAGRTLHGRDRTPEIRAALAELAEAALDRAVDLIVVAGDLFDTRHPSPAAEEAVYEFFLRTGRAGIPSVVIAGNHDHPGRLDAISDVLGLAGARVIGSARVAGRGGAFTLEAGGERVHVAALPFVSERRIVKVTELLEADEGAQRESYQAGMRKLIGNLTTGFTPDAVNLLVMHATMEGATLAHSEYQFHSTSSYALPADALPATANYVALGHIHKPQGVEGVQGHQARYAGSLVQLDFGEYGDRKVAYLLEARPGRPTELLEELPIRSGRPLQRVRLTEDELERRSVELAEWDGWLKVVLALDAPRPGLKDRVMSGMKNAIAVEVELPEHEELAEEVVDPGQVDAFEAYGRYYREQRGQEPSEELAAAFRELYEHVDEPEAEVAR